MTADERIGAMRDDVVAHQVVGSGKNVQQRVVGFDHSGGVFSREFLLDLNHTRERKY